MSRRPPRRCFWGLHDWAPSERGKLTFTGNRRPYRQHIYRCVACGAFKLREVREKGS